MRKLTPIILLFLIVAVWGWTFVVVKEAITEYGVLSFLAVRFSIATLCLAPFTLKRWNRKVLPVGLMAGTVLALGYTGQTFGLELSTPTNTGLITGLFIVFAPLANRLLFGVVISGRLWFSVGLSVLGLALLTGTGTAGFLQGDLFTLGAAVCLGLHVALLDQYAREHDAGLLTFAQMGSAMLIFHGLVLARGELPGIPSPSVWFALVLTGVVASAIAYYIQTFVQQRLSAVQTSVIIMTEPIFATIFGYLLAGDRLNRWQMLGGCLMMCAVALAELSPRPASPAVEEEPKNC